MVRVNLTTRVFCDMVMEKLGCSDEAARYIHDYYDRTDTVCDMYNINRDWYVYEDEYIAANDTGVPAVIDIDEYMSTLPTGEVVLMY